jgi:[acyl-carrier-protein] S-malonyltransferase
VTGSVRWCPSMQSLKNRGITHLVECGVGTVLSGLMKRIDKDIICTSLHTPQDIETFLKG